MPGTPLQHPNPFPSGARHEAYGRCLSLEHAFQMRKNPCTVVQGAKELDSRLAARILGYLLQEIPSDDGKDAFAREVNECTTDDKMKMLAEFYLYNFILLFKRDYDGATPALPDYSPGPFEKQGRNYREMLERATLDYSDAKMHALIRDHYRCVSGGYDPKICYDDEKSDWCAANSNLVGFQLTEAAHIIPKSIDENVLIKGEALKDKRGWAARTILARFSGDQTLPDDLDGRRVHRLENVMTVNPDFHRAFNSLAVWLEATPAPNEYTPRSILNDAMVRRVPNPVVFTSTKPDLYPVPSRDYIALHATCAKVANLSGAAEYVESVWRNIEDARVLSKDGSSSTLLAFALAQAVG